MLTLQPKTIEARALSLFVPQNKLLHSICAESSVEVPTLLHHDLEEHVPIVSDIGPLPNLSEIFSSLGGYTPLVSPASVSVPEYALGTPLGYYAIVGRKIGSFFARLHSPYSLSCIINSPRHGTEFLSNPTMRDIVLDHAIRPLKAQLELFPRILSASEAKILYQRVEDNFVRSPPMKERAMVLGDCWTGAILVGAMEDGPMVGVIDWEFASIGRGVDGDMAQFLAHLQLFQLAASWHEQSIQHQALELLTGELTTAYRRQSITEEVKWAGEGKPAAASLQARMMRSAFLGCAAEMINCAFWKVWPCESPRCGTPHPTEQEGCKLIQQMVEKAVWYLRLAGDDEMEFVKEQNWLTTQVDGYIRRLFQE